MNLFLFFSLLITLISLSIWLGRTKSCEDSQEEFFLMGRRLGLFGLAMTLLATQVGAGAILGAADEAYHYGLSVIGYPMGMALGMVFLGFGFGNKIQSLNLKTVAEIFERAYGSVRLRQIAALLSIFSLFMILAAQAIAARKFLISLGVDHSLLLIVIWLCFTLYTVNGGLHAVVKTDMLQASFILIVMLGALFYGLTHLQPYYSDIEFIAPEASSPWMKWLCVPFFFALIEQDMGQRCCAAKSSFTLTMGTLIAAILLLIICGVSVWFGIQAKALGLTLVPQESILIQSVKALTSPAVSTCVIVAILMAIISTADSLLCAISSNIACDFSIGKNIRTSRLITLMVSLAALISSFFFSSIINTLMFAYELSIPILFVPIFMGVYSQKPSRQAAIVSMLCGAISFPFYRDHALPILYPLLYSALGYSAAYLIRSRRSSEARV